MSDLELQLATAQQELKAVYRERDHFIAALAAFLPATLTESWPDWTLLSMQVDEETHLLWSIAAENRDLFPHVQVSPNPVETDGRSTDEKYALLREITASMAEMAAAMNLAGLPDLLAAAVDDAEREVHDVQLPEPEPEHNEAAEAEQLPDEGVKEPTPEPAPLPRRTPRAKKAASDA